MKDTAVESPSSRTSKSAKSSTARPSKASLKAKREETSASYTLPQRDLEGRLRVWRKVEAAKTGKPAFMVFGDSVLKAIILACPTTVTALQAISCVSARIADNLGADIIALCRAAVPVSQNVPMPSQEVSFRPERSEVKTPPHSSRGATDSGGEPTPTFHRSRVAESDPAAALTPEQALLDTQLRAWRKAESERIGLPQFFVLGSSTLRSIVLIRPKTLAQLQTIAGIGPDKAQKFGGSIVELCRAQLGAP